MNKNEYVIAFFVKECVFVCLRARELIKESVKKLHFFFQKQYLYALITYRLAVYETTIDMNDTALRAYNLMMNIIFWSHVCDRVR